MAESGEASREGECPPVENFEPTESEAVENEENRIARDNDTGAGSVDGFDVLADSESCVSGVDDHSNHCTHNGDVSVAVEISGVLRKVGTYDGEHESETESEAESAGGEVAAVAKMGAQLQGIERGGSQTLADIAAVCAPVIERGAQEDGGAEPSRPGAQGVVLPFHVQGRNVEPQSGGAGSRPGAHTPRGVEAGKSPKSKRIKPDDESRPPVPAGTSEVWYAVEKDGAGWKIRKRWYEMEGGAEVCRTHYLFRIGAGAWERMKGRYTYGQIKIIIADKIKRTERTASRRSA